MIPNIYTFSCESPTKPQTKGRVGKLHVSPASSKLRRKNGMGYIYAISIGTSEKKPANPKKRKILQLSPSDVNRFKTASDLKKHINQLDTKLQGEGKSRYIGLTKFSPRKRLKAHKNSATKGSQLDVHKAMRKEAQNGGKVSATVVAFVPLPLLGPTEEAYRQKVAKENICLNMRKGGAGGGGHKLQF